jgi:hypothetical protein
LARSEKNHSFASADFSKAIASAVEQIQAAQEALGGTTCPSIDTVQINLRDL